MAPALKNQVTNFTIGLTKTLGFIFPKKLILPRPALPGRCTRNPEVTKSNQTDKLVFRDKVSISTMETMLRIMESSPETFERYSCPFMVIQGGLDKVVNP